MHILFVLHIFATCSSASIPTEAIIVVKAYWVRADHDNLVAVWVRVDVGVGELRPRSGVELELLRLRSRVPSGGDSSAKAGRGED